MAKRPYKRFAQEFPGDSVTQQHFKDSANVNNIVARYAATGVDPCADRVGKGYFGHATSKSFTEAMFEVAEVTSHFAELPSEARQAFENDPAKWLDHLVAQREKTPLSGSEAVSDDIAPAPTPEPEAEKPPQPE